MISIKSVTDEKLFYQLLDLAVGESQKSFVASNAFSFAEAWFHKEIARPFAILADDVPVGFFMGCVDQQKPLFGVWRLMIDKRYQGNGYGRAALDLAIDYLRGQGAKEIALSYEPTNTVAAKLYASVGFTLTGEVDDDGEVWAKKALE